MSKIRTAILGYGRSGSSLHADPIEKNEAFEVAAVCDIDAERQKQASERVGCAIYDDYHRMLEQETLDLIVIVTRSSQHCEMTCDCLDAGFNVLVTKPWAVNQDEALRMVEAGERSGKLLLPWLPSRWGCDLRRLKALLAEKPIGDVFLVRRAVCSFATRCDWQTESMYGGGYLLNWGPHIIDTPVQAMGSRVESVYGRMKQTINPGDVEDIFFAVMNLADGTIVQAEYSVSVESLPNWFIQGTEGTIVVRDREVKIYKKIPSQPDDPTKYGTMKAEHEETLEETLEGSIYGDQFEIYGEIAGALTGEGVYPVTPEDALELSRTLDAIRASDEQNCVIAL